MNFVLGFGDTEKRHEANLEEAIRLHVVEQYALRDDQYFTDAFAKEVEAWVKDMAAKGQAAADEYKEAEKFPDRYSRFWVSVLHDTSHIVCILSIHHINRRHAMSPDGWAMMQTERLIHMDVHEAEKMKREAA